MLWQSAKATGTGRLGTRGQTLQEAMRKTLKDRDFHREYRKIVGEGASPLMPEELSGKSKCQRLYSGKIASTTS